MSEQMRLKLEENTALREEMLNDLDQYTDDRGTVEGQVL